jgi:hypothetical protein
MHGDIESANAARLGGIWLGAVVVRCVGVVAWPGAAFGEVAWYVEGGTAGDVEDLLPLRWIVEVRRAWGGVGDGDGAVARYDMSEIVKEMVVLG